jgi:hypothetical protein
MNQQKIKEADIACGIAEYAIKEVLASLYKTNKKSIFKNYRKSITQSACIRKDKDRLYEIKLKVLDASENDCKEFLAKCNTIEDNKIKKSVKDSIEGLIYCARSIYIPLTCELCVKNVVLGDIPIDIDNVGLVFDRDNFVLKLTYVDQTIMKKSKAEQERTNILLQLKTQKTEENYKKFYEVEKIINQFDEVIKRRGLETEMKEINDMVNARAKKIGFSIEEVLEKNVNKLPYIKNE